MRNRFSFSALTVLSLFGERVVLLSLDSVFSGSSYFTRAMVSRTLLFEKDCDDLEFCA